MKHFIRAVFVFLAFSSVSFAAENDTTFFYSLQNNGSKDKIGLHFDEDSLIVTLNVNNSSFSYYAISPGESYLNIVKSEGRNLIMVITPDYYGYECVLFSYVNRIDSLGEIYSFDLPVIASDGLIKATHWFGFWSAEVEYLINRGGIALRYKDEYEIPPKIRQYIITTVDKIYLHSSKMLNSKGLYEVPKGVRVYFLKADIRDNCPDNTEIWQQGCNWYYIKTSTGVEGWIMEREFTDKIDGIPYAG
ncbi:MAG: hypothetical protein LWX07_04115 [Bacteroidetes bacterium]|nr:hypothetical protein [Bacteroidota bacterium]